MVGVTPPVGVCVNGRVSTLLEILQMAKTPRCYSGRIIDIVSTLLEILRVER